MLKDKEARLALMENTQEQMADLRADLEACNQKMEADAKALGEEDEAQILVPSFNKTNYTIPDLQETIQDLAQMIKEEEADQEEDELNYGALDG